MKVFLNPSDFLCECGSHMYVERHGPVLHMACVSMYCEDFNVLKIVRCIEIPYTKSPAKVTLGFDGLDLGEKERQAQIEQEKQLEKEARSNHSLKMFSG